MSRFELELEHAKDESAVIALCKKLGRAQVIEIARRHFERQRERAEAEHRRMNEEAKRVWLAEHPNSGHGHVFPRPDGVKARCGGPGLCKECSRDQASKERQP